MKRNCGQVYAHFANILRTVGKQMLVEMEALRDSVFAYASTFERVHIS